ncbi:MAG: cell division protein FtsA [Syntrophomonadaceae bacterium]
MVALDVGTHTVKAAMAEVVAVNSINVLGISAIPARGMRKGHIVDIELAAQDMEEALNALERLTGIEISSASIGFSGISLSTINNHTVVAVGTPSYEISQDDKSRVLHSARNISLPPDKTIVQVVERQYIIDGYDGVKEPVGMVGSRLEVEITVIIAALAAVQNLQRSANRINLEIEALVFNPLFTAEAVLMPTEMEMGVALVDIGGGTVDVSVFERGSLLCASVLPLGGEHITRDLAIILKTSLEEAAGLKERSEVMACPDDDDKVVVIKDVKGQVEQRVSQQLVSEIISARVLEIAHLVFAELRQMDAIDRIPAGIVVTGGGAELNGIAELFEEYLGIPVRLGTPDRVTGLAGEYRRPCYGAVVGGLICAAQHIQPYKFENRRGLSALIDRMGEWYRDFFR